MQLLRSILFTGSFFLITTVYAVVVLSVCWLPTRYIHAIARHWATVLLWLLKVICNLDYVVEGRENIPPGNHVSMWKHSSAWETIAQAVIFPPQAWVLKRELTWIPLVGWAMRFVKPIAIDRGAARAAVNQVLKQGAQRLAEGLWILIFPEGTRTAPGEQGRYGISGALLACRAGKKIVPVAHTAGYYWQRRGLTKKRGTIRVIIGPPIETTGRDPRVVNEEVRKWIEGTMTRIAPAGKQGS
jgi:1-acyl-sn-glycerol-3-phosphate acyltransferase